MHLNNFSTADSGISIKLWIVNPSLLRSLLNLSIATLSKLLVFTKLLKVDANFDSLASIFDCSSLLLSSSNLLSIDSSFLASSTEIPSSLAFFCYQFSLLYKKFLAL